MDERELLRRQEPVVGERADVLPVRGLRIRGDHATRRHQRVSAELVEEPRAHPARADVAGASRLEVAVQQRAGDRADGRGRGEAVDHRHPGEDEPHPVPAALAVAHAQLARDPCRLFRRVPGSHEAALDLAGRALRRLGIERVAAEQVDLVELREQSRARIAARDALHLGDRQVLAHRDLVGEEHLAAVVVAGDDEDVAAQAGAARRLEPVRPVPLDQLDEREPVGRQAPAERVPLVGRVDRDRADRLRAGWVRGESGHYAGPRERRDQRLARHAPGGSPAAGRATRAIPSRRDTAGHDHRRQRTEREVRVPRASQREAPGPATDSAIAGTGRGRRIERFSLRVIEWMISGRRQRKPTTCGARPAGSTAGPQGTIEGERLGS